MATDTSNSGRLRPPWTPEHERLMMRVVLWKAKGHTEQDITWCEPAFAFWVRHWRDGYADGFPHYYASRKGATQT